MTIYLPLAALYALQMVVSFENVHIFCNHPGIWFGQPYCEVIPKVMELFRVENGVDLLKPSSETRLAGSVGPEDLVNKYLENT